MKRRAKKKRTGALEPKAQAKPAAELYPGHAAESARKAERDRHVAQANAEPFPGPLADAFANGPIRLGEFTVREFVPMDAALLRRLDSPFYRQLLEILKPKEQRQATPCEDLDEWVVIYLFTRPCAEAEAVLNQGVAEFQRQARAAFAHNPRLNLALYQDLFEACAHRIITAFDTALRWRTRDPEALPGQAEVFTMPPPAKMTASAGG